MPLCLKICTGVITGSLQSVDMFTKVVGQSFLVYVQGPFPFELLHVSEHNKMADKTYLIH